jgi:hypothetical protein
MPVQRRKRHSEERWKLLPETIIRCRGHNPNGRQCGFEAEAGSVVCERHGGAAPQVRRRAAERLILTADEAAQMLVRMMQDQTVPHAVRVKIATDLLDRAGLIATQVHQIIPTSTDPVTLMFERLLGDPSNFVDAPSGKPEPSGLSAIGYTARDHFPNPDAESEIIDAEIVGESATEPQPESVNGDDSPQRIKQMIKDGAFTNTTAAQ